MNTNDSITGETPEDPRKGWVSLADFPVDSYVLQFVEMADSWSSFYLRFALLDYEMKTVEFHPGQKMIRINKKEHMLTTESVARILETLATLQDQKKEADVSAQEIPKAIEPIQQGVKSNVDGLELGLDAPRGWVRLRGLPESLPISLTDDYGVTAKYICTTDQRSVEVDFPSRKLCLNGKIVYGTLTSSTIRLLSQYIPRSDEEIARGATSIRFGEGKEAPVDAHAPRDAEGSPEAPHASTGAPHAHPSGSSREDLKPEKFGGSGLTIKAIGIGGWRDWVRGYRELREKGSVATAADNTARFSIGGGIAYGAAEVSKYLGANWISMGFAPMKFGWIPGIGAIIGGGTLLARAGADKARYERWVRQKFEQTARDAKLDTETEEQALEYIRAQIEKNCDIHSNKLLNDDAEQHIIQALHKSGIAKPALAPYLGSEKQYAEYCFTQLTALCAAASVEHANIAGLNHHEVDALKKYHLETAEDKEAIRKSLVEMCNVYARLVGGYHRDKRESQVYGAVIGASLSMAGQSGGLSIVGGGLLLGARRMWVENKKSKLHIELDSKGDLVGKKKGKRREHVVSPELSRGEFTLVDHDVFHASAEMKAADLPDRAKKWLPKLVLPHHLHDMEFANAEQMGQEASAEVMSNLKNQTNLKKPGTPFEIEQAQKASDAEAQMLRELEKELRELPDKLDDAQAQFRKADSSLGATGPEERARRQRAEVAKEELDRLEGELASFQPKGEKKGVVGEQSVRVSEALRELREAEEKYNEQQKKFEAMQSKKVQRDAVAEKLANRAKITSKETRLTNEIKVLDAEIAELYTSTSTGDNVVEELRAKRANLGELKEQATLLAKRKEKLVDPLVSEDDLAEEIRSIEKTIEEVKQPVRTDIDRATRTHDREEESLNELLKKEKELPERIEKARKVYETARAVLGAETPEERGRKAEAKALAEKVSKLESRQKSLGTSLIEAQRRRVEVANKAYSEARDGKESKDKLTIEKILEDEDLLKAFAVKIHTEFKHLQEQGKKRTWLGVIGHWAKGKVIEQVKDTGDVLLESGKYGAITASLGVGVALFASWPVIPVAVIAGGATAILVFLQKMRAPNAKGETKTDSHKH